MNQNIKRMINNNFYSLSHSVDNKKRKTINRYNQNKEVVYKLNFKNDGLVDIDNEPLKIKTSIFNQDLKNNQNPQYLYKSIENIKTFLPNINISLEAGNNAKIEKIIYQRLQNQEYENILKKKINEFSLEKGILNMKMDELINDLHKNENEIADTQVSISLLSEINFYLTYNKSNSNYNIDKGNLNVLNNNLKEEKNVKNNENKKINWKQIINNKEMIIQKIKSKGSIKIKDLKTTLDNLKNEKKEILKQIKNLEYKKEILRIKKNSLTQELYKHYLEILKIGKDTRSEGLSWIIKEIFLLKKKVLISYLPEYLDHLGRIFLFKQAKMKIDLEELDKRIKLVKQELLDKGIFKDSENLDFIKKDNIDYLNKSETENSLNVNNISKDNSESEIKNIKNIIILGAKNKNYKNLNNIYLKKKFKSNPKLEIKLNNNNNLIKINNNPIRHFSITNYSEKNDSTANSTKYNGINKHKDKNKLLIYSNYNNIPDIIKLNDYEKYIKITNSNSKLKNKDVSDLIEEFIHLNKKFKDLKLEQEIMKKEEMDRIFNEYLRNNYYQRYNVEKNVVLSALIGEDNINNELNKQIKRAKKYFENVKSYSLGHKRLNKKYIKFDKNKQIKLIGDTFFGGIY